MIESKGACMYQSFRAVVLNGKIQPLEKIKLKESQIALVTLVDDESYSEGDLKKLNKWLSKERKAKRTKIYSSVSEAKTHFSS